MGKRIPYLLIYLRLLGGIVIPLLGLFVDDCGEIILSIMVFALLSDIFDGIIARRLGIATEKLRILDSNVDMVFWLSTILTLFVLNSSFFWDNWIAISGLILLELSCYLVAYLKFKRTVATHTLLAKGWTISLFIFLADLALTSNSSLAFIVCVILGVISRVEIIAILISLKTWATDVPSIFSVQKLNKGEEIKRMKLFN